MNLVCLGEDWGDNYCGARCAKLWGVGVGRVGWDC